MAVLVLICSIACIRCAAVWLVMDRQSEEKEPSELENRYLHLQLPRLLRQLQKKGGLERSGKAEW